MYYVLAFIFSNSDPLIFYALQYMVEYLMYILLWFFTGL